MVDLLKDLFDVFLISKLELSADLGKAGLETLLGLGFNFSNNQQELLLSKFPGTTLGTKENFDFLVYLGLDLSIQISFKFGSQFLDDRFSYGYDIDFKS